jgi:hypothetical protein
MINAVNKSVAEILSYIGKEIYVITQHYKGHMIVKRHQIYAIYLYGKEANENGIMFVYNFECDDCFDYFVETDIGNTVFFTKEEALGKLNNKLKNK